MTSRCAVRSRPVGTLAACQTTEWHQAENALAAFRKTDSVLRRVLKSSVVGDWIFGDYDIQPNISWAIGFSLCDMLGGLRPVHLSWQCMCAQIKRVVVWAVGSQRTTVLRCSRISACLHRRRSGHIPRVLDFGSARLLLSFMILRALESSKGNAVRWI